MIEMVYLSHLLLSCIFSFVAAHSGGFSIHQSNGQVNVHFGHPPGVQKRDAEGFGLQKRQNCGPSIGSCPKGQCCQASGLCGTGTDYCKGPQCLLDYSDSCDALIPPPGSSTANIPRPHIGNVPYGLILNDCVVPGTMALTFDDGPWTFTSQLLDILEKYNTTATFFICGNNLGKGRIDDPSTPWPAVLQRMHSKGHQLASHSYTHQDLTIVNPSIQQSQIIYNEMAFRNLFGFFPTYFRPPYTFCTAVSGCPAILNTMGYHIINLDIDTKDYLNDDPNLIQNSKNTFNAAVSPDAPHHSYIELSHDVHYNTVINLTAFMIQTSLSRGYRLVTVGECLGDPPANWYRDAGGVNNKAAAVSSSALSSSSSSSSSSSNPLSTSTPSSGSVSSSASNSPGRSSSASSAASQASSNSALLLSSVTIGAFLSSGTSSGSVVAATSKSSGGISVMAMGWGVGALLGMSLCLCAVLTIN